MHDPIIFVMYSLFSSANSALKHETSKQNQSSKTEQTSTVDSKIDDLKPIQTFNLLERLPSPSPIPIYDRFAYISIEHNYAIMAKQPIPIAQRLTVDGLHDLGVDVPITNTPVPKFSVREHDAEMRIMYDIDQGIDEEDMSYLKQSFQM